MNSLQQPVFAASLPPAGLGEFHFGYTDPKKFRPPLWYANVDGRKGHWQFQSPGVLVADRVFNGPSPTIVGKCCCPSQLPIIISLSIIFVIVIVMGEACILISPFLPDTGSSLLRLYFPAVQYYYSKVPGVRYNKDWGGYYFPCNAPLPPLHVGLVGTYSGYVSPQMLRGPVLSGNCKYSFTTCVRRNSPFAMVLPLLRLGLTVCWGARAVKDCLGGLQVTEDRVQSLGVVFLKSQYVVYDYGTLGIPRLGFAPHA
jgi:hypothetical protein